MTLKIGRFQLQTQRAYGISLRYVSFSAPEIITDCDGDTFGFAGLTILGHQIRVFY